VLKVNLILLNYIGFFSNKKAQRWAILF